MEAFVVLLSTPFLVQVDAWVVAENNYIATTL